MLNWKTLKKMPPGLPQSVDFGMPDVATVCLSSLRRRRIVPAALAQQFRHFRFPSRRKV